MQVISCAAVNSKHFSALLSLDDGLVSAWSICEYSVHLLKNRLVKGRRFLDSTKQLGAVVPLVDALFYEGKRLVPVGIQMLPQYFRGVKLLVFSWVVEFNRGV
jgi:hypothetical protein